MADPRCDAAPRRRRLRTHLVWIVAALVLATGVSRVIAGAQYSTGPDASVSGARAVGGVRAENNCTNCHYTMFGDVLNTAGGKLEILDLPDTYQAGVTYDFRVRLQSDSTVAFPDRKWGFQLIAIQESNGASTGTFQLEPGDSLQIIAGDPPFSARSYLEHTSIATRTGLDGPVEWRLHWQAPASPAGKVLFFAAGNAANGNHEPEGDFIFTTSDSVLDATTAARPSSWGALKARYR